MHRDHDRPPRERGSHTRGIDWEWEGSRPPRQAGSDPTDAGYDEAAHRGSRYGVAEGRGGVFGTSGGGTYGDGFQVEDRFRSPRGDWRDDILDEREGIAPSASTSAGRWSGRGPRNYRRPDERILDEIHERLESDGWVDATDVEVKVTDGEVRLGGTVEDRSMRRRAEEIVDHVSGVAHVNNDLRVRRR